MSTNEDIDKLIELLNEEMGLTPYESRAYMALLQHGPLSPQGVNQKSGIPRPRTYDVLNSLLGKGLLIEEPGKPRFYAAVDPRVGLDNMMAGIESKMLRQLEEKRKATERLISTLSKLHDESREMALEEGRVWVTRTNIAFVVRYCEAVRNIEKEYVIANASPTLPEKKSYSMFLDAVMHVLKKNKSVRVLRPIKPSWTRDELEEYEKLISLGYKARHLEYEGLTFAVFDANHTVLWLPPEPPEYTVWINFPSLATILYEHFEELWERGQPALPVIKKLKATKV